MSEDTRQIVNQDDDDDDDDKKEEDRASSRGHIFFDASAASSASASASSPSSSFVPPGSNVACNNSTVRVRKKWNDLSNYDRALYLDAIETAVERGYHQRFAKFHYDTLSEIQAHDTCGFFIWHRIFVLAYEDMLRSLGARYVCLTIPYWDIYSDYRNQQSQRVGIVCRSYATCSRITNELGGIVTIGKQSADELTYIGDTVEGVRHFQSPVQNLRDDNNRAGVIRGDRWFENPIPSQAILLHPSLLFPLDRRAFQEQLHHGIHDTVHETIGGLMHTNASPLDPIFMPLHSTMELYDYLWEVCHSNSNQTTTTTNDDDDEMMTNLTDDTVDDNDANDANDSMDNRCTYTKEAQQYFPNISIDGNGNDNNNNNNNNEEVYMKLNNDTDIRDDPLIGQYFSLSLTYYANYSNILQLNQHQRFRYSRHNLPELLLDALSNKKQLCPNGLSSLLTSQTPTTPATPNEPPTFTTLQIDTFKFEWMNQAHVYLSIAQNNATSTTTTTTTHPHQQQQELYYNNNMEFVTCLLMNMDQDTLERWAIDEGTFLTQVLQNKRYHNHPSCRDHLAAGSNSNNNNNNDHNHNSNTTIKNSSSSSHTILYYGRQQRQQCCYSACSWLVFLLLLQIVLFKLME